MVRQVQALVLVARCHYEDDVVSHLAIALGASLDASAAELLGVCLVRREDPALL